MFSKHCAMFAMFESHTPENHTETEVFGEDKDQNKANGLRGAYRRPL